MGLTQVKCKFIFPSNPISFFIMVTKPKCVFRIRLETRLQEGETPIEDKCYSCFGYRTICEDYTDLNHILSFYELYKIDRQKRK
jgi:hypothetical protein